MNCSEVEKILLSNEGKDRDTEIQRHLDACGSCREFKQLLDALNESDNEKMPSPALDARVMTMARHELSRIRRIKQLRWDLKALAACIVIGLFVVGMIALWPTGRVGTTETVAVAPQQGIQETESSLDALMFDCLTADYALEELEGDFKEFGLFEAEKGDEVNDSYGVVFEDSLDLEASMNELELLVYGM
ncbi:MAG: hypothetical protein J6X55_08240 [Victivallales bacterium]|nr:hypothetical protein [Victivallales bacterium]